MLAAGRGSRMGGSVPKPLVPLDGRPMVFRVLDGLSQAGIARATLVLGHEGARIQRAVEAEAEISENTGANVPGHFPEHFPGHCAVRFRVCPQWALGFAESMRYGLRFLASHTSWTHALVCLADMPLVRASTYRRLHERVLRQPELAILFPQLGSLCGHPPVLSRAVWLRLIRDLAGGGDTGPRKLLANYAREGTATAYLSVDDPGILRDFDTPF